MIGFGADPVPNVFVGVLKIKRTVLHIYANGYGPVTMRSLVIIFEAMPPKRRVGGIGEKQFKCTL